MKVLLKHRKRGCQGRRAKRALTPRISRRWLVQFQQGLDLFSCSITGSVPDSESGLCKFESYWENFFAGLA